MEFDAVKDIYENPPKHIKFTWDVLKQIFSKFKGKKILDLGCGTGYWSFFFKELGNKVYALDLSREMVKKVKNRSRKKGKIYVIMGDINKLPLKSNTFDIILLLGNMLTYLKDFSELIRVLKKEGLIIGTVDNKVYWSLIKFRETGKFEILSYINKKFPNSNFKTKLFSIEDLENLAQKYNLEVIEVSGINFLVPFRGKKLREFFKKINLGELVKKQVELRKNKEFSAWSQYLLFIFKKR